LDENLSNGVKLGLGLCPKEQLSGELSKKSFWGSVDIGAYLHDAQFSILSNRPGNVSVSYHGQTNTDGAITLHGINGQKLFSSSKLHLQNGHIFDIKIGLPGVYIVRFSSGQTILTLKTTG
jgi:hypothetical protein